MDATTGPNDEARALSEEGRAGAAPAVAGPPPAEEGQEGQDEIEDEDEDEDEGYGSDAFEGYDSDAEFEEVGPAEAKDVATALEAFRQEQGWVDKGGEPEPPLDLKNSTPIPYQRQDLSAPPATLAFLRLPALVAELVSDPSLSHSDLRSLALVASPFVHPVQKQLFRHLQINTPSQSGRLLEVLASHTELAELSHSMDLALGNVRATLKPFPLLQATIESLRELQDFSGDREWEDEGRRRLGSAATGEELAKLWMDDICDGVLRDFSNEDFRDAENHLDAIYGRYPFVGTSSRNFLTYHANFVSSLSFLSKPTSVKLSFPASTVPSLFLPHLSSSLTSLTIRHPIDSSQSQQLSGWPTYTLYSERSRVALSAGADLTISSVASTLRTLDLRNLTLVTDGECNQPAKWQLEECRLDRVSVESLEVGWYGAEDQWRREKTEEVETEETDARGLLGWGGWGGRVGWGVESDANTAANPSAEQVASTSIDADYRPPRLVNGDDEIPALVPYEPLSDLHPSSPESHRAMLDRVLSLNEPNNLPPSSSPPPLQSSPTPRPLLSLNLFLGPAHNSLRSLFLDSITAFSDESILDALAAHAGTLEWLSITRSDSEWQPTRSWKVGEARPTAIEGEGKREVSHFAKVLRRCGALKVVRLGDEEGVPSWDADVVDALAKGGAKLEWVSLRLRADGRSGKEWDEWEASALRLEGGEAGTVSVIWEEEGERHEVEGSKEGQCLSWEFVA